MMLTVCIVILLLAIAALFALMEAAILSVSPAKIRKMSNDGDKRAVLVEALREDKEKFIGTILLCNNVVCIASSALATDLALEAFGDGGFAILIVTAVMTFLVVIYSEILPKTYAVRNAEMVSLRCAWFSTQLVRALYPIMYLINHWISAMLSIFRLNARSGIEISALESIRSTLDIHHKEGEVRTDVKHMIAGIIDLEEMSVNSVMIHKNNMYTVNIDEPISSILQKLVGSPHSRIPVWKGDADNIIGVVHIKDVTQVCLESQAINNINTQNILDIMREPWFIPDITNLKMQLKNFREKHYHFALIVNEYGDLEGFVTLEDIIEEVVGQIQDEYDVSSEAVIQLNKDGSITIAGDTSIRDINREMEWDINGGDIATVGGLLFHSAQRIPEIGEEFIWQKYRLKLIKKRHNKILTVLVKPI